MLGEDCFALAVVNQLDEELSTVVPVADRDRSQLRLASIVGLLDGLVVAEHVCLVVLQCLYNSTTGAVCQRLLQGAAPRHAGSTAAALTKVEPLLGATRAHRERAAVVLHVEILRGGVGVDDHTLHTLLGLRRDGDVVCRLG